MSVADIINAVLSPDEKVNHPKTWAMIMFATQVLMEYLTLSYKVMFSFCWKDDNLRGVLNVILGYNQHRDNKLVIPN